jgi:hypothetical protein
MGALTASTLVTRCGQPLLPSQARRYGVVSATGRLALDARILACAAQRGTSMYLIAGKRLSRGQVSGAKMDGYVSLGAYSCD